MGAAAAAAALAGVTYLLLARRQRRRRSLAGSSAATGATHKDASTLSSGAALDSADGSSRLQPGQRRHSADAMLQLSPFTAAAAAAPPFELPSALSEQLGPMPHQAAGSLAGSTPSVQLGALPPYSAAGKPLSPAGSLRPPLHPGSAAGAAVPASPEIGEAARLPASPLPRVGSSSAVVATRSSTLASSGSLVGAMAERSRQRDALPELVRLVQAREAVVSSSGLNAEDSNSDEAPEHQLLVPGTLPPQLRQHLIDGSQVRFLRWPSGKRQELGSGAR